MAKRADDQAPEIEAYNPGEDFYQLLDVQPDATPQQIRKAHRARMQAAHPDRGGSHRQAAMLNHARDTLLDAQLRHRYDQKRASWQQALRRARARVTPKSSAARNVTGTAGASAAVPPSPPLQLFTLVADQDVARAFMAGEWANALSVAILGRLCDWLLDTSTSSDPARSAMLRQIGAHVQAEQLRQVTMVTRDMLLHLLPPRSPRRPSEAMDLEAIAASVAEVLRGEAPTPRSFARRAAPASAPASAEPTRPSSRRTAPSAPVTTTKRARTRSTRVVGRQRRRP